MGYTGNRNNNHYVVVIPAHAAIQISNLLSTLKWLRPEGIDAELAGSDNYDPWEYITGTQIEDAYQHIREALEENWLGTYTGTDPQDTTN